MFIFMFFTRNSKWLFDFQTRIPCDTNHHWLFTIKSEDVYLRQWKLQIHRFTGEQSVQYNDLKKNNSFQMLDRWSWQIQTFHRRSWRARGVKKTNWRWSKMGGLALTPPSGPRMTHAQKSSALNRAVPKSGTQNKTLPWRGSFELYRSVTNLKAVESLNFLIVLFSWISKSFSCWCSFVNLLGLLMN